MDVLDLMAANPKICNYLDMPLQHISTKMLKAMKRQTTREYTEGLISNIRERVPGITLRTTMMVGFPGESQEDFEELVDFVSEMQFDRLGVFAYSHEEGTTAGELQDDVSEEIKTERLEQLMEVQKDISNRKNAGKIGEVIRVLVDRKEGEYFIARTEGDSPEVDNEVLIDAKVNYLRIGEFITVKITDANDFDLFAKTLDN